MLGMRYGRGSDNALFSKYNGFAVIESQRKQLNDEVASLPEQRLLNTSVEDLVRYLAQKYEIEVPVLIVDEAVADQKEAKVEVRGFQYGLERGESRSIVGTVVTLEIPFTGDAQVFNVQPSSYDSMPPRADIRDQVVVLTQSGAQLSADEVQAGFDRTIQDINKYLGWHREDAKSFNDSLPTQARHAIEQRRNKLLSNQNLVAGLKFKLKERTDAPKTYSAPVQRKRIEPLPPASTAPYKPEPTLPEEDYKNILKIIQDMTIVMERSPAAFAHMGEEDIRQHFLVQLNGHYEGMATGETFNAEGKTDILVRHEGRNIFIAECKFWRGEKAFLETIDQVSSYLSWRDTKVALVIFNKNRDFSNVLEKIKEVTPKHPLFKSGPKVEDETRFRYLFGQKGDANREVVLTVLAFDVPQPEEKMKGEPHVRKL
jgi:hypothetical protein